MGLKDNWYKPILAYSRFAGEGAKELIPTPIEAYAIKDKGLYAIVFLYHYKRSQPVLRLYKENQLILKRPYKHFGIKINIKKFHYEDYPLTNELKDILTKLPEDLVPNRI